MSIMGLVIGLVLLTVVVLFVAAPVLRASRLSQVSPSNPQRERVLAYYERVVGAIRDLDEDHALGKIDASAYQRERALWAERGVQALSLLDGMGEDAAPASDLDAQIEDMVAHARLNAVTPKEAAQ
jgi:hypothetical protein